MARRVATRRPTTGGETLITIDNLDRGSRERYTPHVHKSSEVNNRPARAFTFGIDKAPAARPWRENRLICAPTVTQVYVGETGMPIPAEILNVSRSGLCLVLKQPVGVGSAVKVQLAGMIAVGEIRYCIQTRADSFNAGMRIDSTQKLV